MKPLVHLIVYASVRILRDNRMRYNGHMIAIPEARIASGNKQIEPDPNISRRWNTFALQQGGIVALPHVPYDFIYFEKQGVGLALTDNAIYVNSYTEFLEELVRRVTVFYGDVDIQIGTIYDSIKRLKRLPDKRAYTHAKITTTTQLLETLRAGEYAWPGGYPLFFITNDGEAVSFDGVKEHLRSALWDIRDGYSGRIVGCEINWEDEDLICAHTNKKIPSAYGEPAFGEQIPIE